MAVAVCVGLLVARAHAATEYFDLNGSATGSGVTNNGNYSWEASGWTTSTTGTSSTHNWVEGSVASFSAGTDAGGKSYTINANSNHTITGLQVSAAGNENVTINGPGILTISNLNPQTFYVRSSTSSLRINAVLAGTSGAVQWGAPPTGTGGSLYLYGVNTYEGSTTIRTSLPLYFNNAKSFGNANIYFENEGYISNPDTTGPLTIANHVQMGSARVTYSGHDPVTFTNSWAVGGTLTVGDAQFPNSKMILNGQLFGGSLKVDSAYDGVVVLGNPNPPSNYTGGTTIGGTAGGLPVLQAIENQGLPSTRITLNGGILQGNSAFSNNFTRPLASSGKSITWGENGGGFAQLTVNLGGDSRELVWGTNIGTQLVGPLKFGSASAMGYTQFQNPIDLNGGVRTLYGRMANTQQAAQLTGVIRDSGTGGGLLKTGPATIALSAANTYSGTTTINEGTLWANDGVGLPAASFLNLDGGVLGGFNNVTFSRSLGTSASAFQWNTNGGGFSGAMTVNIGGTGAELVWGTDVGTQIVGPLKFGNGGFSGTTSFVNGIDLNDTATQTTRVIDVAGDKNTVAHLSGVLRQSGASTGLTKTGPGKLMLTGANTYSGHTTLAGGILSVSTVGDGNAPSPIGQAPADSANLVFGGGTLQYTGTGETTNRQFTLGTGTTAGTIDASGTGPLQLTSTSSVAMTGSGTRTLILAGTNTGDNTLSAAVGNDGANATSLTKNDAGRWMLPRANTYSGTTTFAAGTLVVGNDQALGGSGLRFAGGAIAASGETRNISNDIVLANTMTVTGAYDITFTGSIVATGAKRAVAANGSGNVVELAGPINISDSSTDRTLTLTGTSNMKVSGVIANGGTSTAGRLTKAGTPSTVVLTANNTYAGKTTITGGTLVVSSLNSVVGGTASSNLGAPKNVADGTIPIGAAQNSGSLRYIGPGETTDRVIDLAGTSGGATIDSSGDGPLAFTSAFTATGADSKTLTLQGTNAGDNTVAGAIVNNSATNKTSLVKSGTGKWILSGASSYSGGTTISDGTLVVSGGTGTLGLGHVTVQSTVDSKLQILSGVANAIGDTATLNLVGGGSPDVADQGYVDLGGGIQERVGLVQLNGIAQPRGLSYGSTASGAMIQLDEYFAGAGLVTAGILGDFNGNNTVDTGDFVVWRKNPAVYGGSAGYDLWRVNLGATSSASGSELAGDVGSVPEPSSFLLALSALFAAGRRRHRCKSGSTDRGTEQDDSGRNCGR